MITEHHLNNSEVQACKCEQSLLKAGIFQSINKTLLSNYLYCKCIQMDPNLSGNYEGAEEALLYFLCVDKQDWGNLMGSILKTPLFNSK